MTVDAHPKEFIGVELHQTVFLIGLDKYISIVLHCTKKALYKGLATLRKCIITLYNSYSEKNAIMNMYMVLLT